MSDLDDAVRIGKALSDRTRVRILAALAVRDLCVCELTALVDVGQPAVSRHLGILRGAGLVEDVRDRKWVNYRLRTARRTPFATAVLRSLGKTLATDPRTQEIQRRAMSVDRNKLQR